MTRRALLGLAASLLLPALALAHEPAPLTVMVRITEEKMTIELCVREELFREWVKIEPELLTTVTEEEYPAVKAAVEAFVRGASPAEIDRIAVRLEAEHGLTSVVFSPCERRPRAGQDYLSVMRANLERLAPVLTDR